MDRLFSLLIEKVPLGVLVTDFNGKNLFASQWLRKLYGVGPDVPLETFDGHEFEVYHPDGTRCPTEELPLYKAITKRHAVEPTELHYRRYDGQMAVAMISATPLEAEDGNGYVLVICEDITTTRQAVNAAKMRADRLAISSHEIRTPVHGILGTLDLLLDTSLDTAQREHLKSLQGTTRRLLDLLNDLLDLSKIDANRIRLEKDVYDLRDVLADVQHVFSGPVKKKKIEFKCQVDDDVPKIYGDETRVHQCINNLVSNAVKFTDTGEVSVTARMAANKVVVNVRDTGIGMNDSALSNLFEPYSQGHSTTRYGGTGLGLSITKQLVELMDGEISVQSQAGQGTTFTMTLPITENNSARKRKRREHVSNTVLLYGKRMLLADDDEVCRRIAQKMLEKCGSKVIAVDDGVHAYEAIRGGLDVDIILLDVQMPTMDGIETCKRLRQFGWNKPIVALTADAMEMKRIECIEAGMDDFVTKPFESHTLTACLEGLLG